MRFERVTFETEENNLNEMDALADARKLHRDVLLNEAVVRYLRLQEDQQNMIREGLRDAQQGRLTPHDQVVARIKTWSSAR
jgi:predicted transcriptional regulator